MARPEHILLESDERELPTLETARRIHGRAVLRGGPGRRTTELALIDYFYLSVRIAHAQSVESRYVVDLRFVDPEIRLKRRVAWRWLAAGIAFLALAILGARDVAGATGPWWRHEWLLPAAALSGLAACALLAAFHLSTETLALLSAHGRAKLVAHVGGVGTLRALRAFRPRLEAHLRISCGARRRSRAQHLRDEMREHFRLRSAGAITAAEYEDAKRRILATHVPPGAAKKKARESPPGPSRPMIRA